MQVRYQLRQRPRAPKTLPPGQFGSVPHRAPPVQHRPTIHDVTSIGNANAAGSDSSTGTSPLPDLEQHLRRVAEEGYTILPDAIEPELVDEIDEALLKLEHDLGTVPADNLFEGVRTMRVYNLLRHGPTFEKIPLHPNVLP